MADTSTPKHFLLTGANGFIATHILAQLLSLPSTPYITATVRSATKAASLRALFPAASDARLALHLVPDLAAPGAWDAVFASPASSSSSAAPPIDTVLHTASPFLYRAATGSNTEAFLDPAIKGTKGLLEAAGRAGTVRRVVMTSSCAAVIDYKREAQVEREGGQRKVYDETDWNDVTYAEGEEGDKSTAYRASKKFSELVAWEFVNGKGAQGEIGGKDGVSRGGFDLVVLCPPAVIGPVVEGSVRRIEDLGESNTRFYKLFVDSKKDKEIANKMPLHVYVDVRDLAHAHILAAIVPEARNKRFLICAGSFSNRDVTQAIRGAIPELEKRTPIGKEESGLSPTDYGYSSERAKEVLSVTYRAKEETFVELARQLFKIEQQEGR